MKSREILSVKSFFQDLRFGMRIVLRSPLISSWVVLALALGTGANTAMFSVVDALLLRPVNYADPENVVLLWEVDAQGVQRNVSAANFLDWRTRTKSFSDIAGWAPASFVMTGAGLDGGRAQQMRGGMVTANFFRTLGVQPALGRTFLPDEDGIATPGAPARVAVIGYPLWQERFGGRPDVLSQTIELNSISHRVIGVMPAGFRFFPERYIWIPASINSADRDYRYILTLARRTASKQAAAAEMSALAAALAQEYPDSNKGWTVQAQDVLEWLLDRTFRMRLLLLFAAVGLLLLITCTNVAGLLLTRAAARTREMALRAALGAGSVRLIRQVLTESLVLALLGGALGLAVAWGLIRAIPAVLPAANVASALPVQLNVSVTVFAILAAVGASLVFGLAPALSGLHMDLQSTLREGTRGATAGRKRQQFRRAMVALQVALALVLLASAALMRESLTNLSARNPGVVTRNVLTARLFLPEAQFGTARSLALQREALQRIQAVPGVLRVTAGSDLPLRLLTMNVPFDLETSPPRPDAEKPGVGYVSVMPGYFETLGIPVKTGRAFDETDRESAAPVVIVNEAFAERYFPAQNPTGKRLLLSRPMLGKDGFEKTMRVQIVGVVGNVGTARSVLVPEPILYAPQTQNVWSGVTWFAVRTAGAPDLAASAVRSELAELGAGASPPQIDTLEQAFASQLTEPRFQAQVMSGFAALAMILAVIGIYGVNAYAVAQRRHEIGVRMALGASPGAVRWQVLASGMRVTLVGIAGGLAGALAIASLLRSVLVGISATDPATLAAVAVVLALVAALACYLPARHAARIDPAVCLREE